MNAFNDFDHADNITTKTKKMAPIGFLPRARRQEWLNNYAFSLFLSISTRVNLLSGIPLLNYAVANEHSVSVFEQLLCKVSVEMTGYHNVSAQNKTAWVGPLLSLMHLNTWCIVIGQSVCPSPFWAGTV